MRPDSRRARDVTFALAVRSSGQEVRMATVETALRITGAASESIELGRPAWLSRELFPFESRFLSAGGTRFHYVDEGRGPTLLFLHGGPMSSFMWRHQLGALRGRHRCVAVDLPGLGLSRTELVRGEGFAKMAEALQAFVRALELDRFVMIAHATGGPSGLEMAVRERARVRGLVLSNTFGWPIGAVPQMRRMVRIVSSRPFGFLVVRLNLLARIAARKARRHGELSAEERAAVLGPYRELRTRLHLANLLHGLRSETPFFARLEQRLAALAEVPALLLFGAEDNNYKAGAADRFARLLPSSTRVAIPGAAHFLTEDAPEAYTAALDGWLARL
jgi:haloalkane dehalogenase